MTAFFHQLLSIEFAYPWLLCGLLLLPVIARWSGRAGVLPSLVLPSLRAVRGIGKTPRPHPGGWRLAAPMLIFTLLVLALARPRMRRGDLPDPTKGIDIMLTLDFSRSMAEHDFHLDGKRVSRREALENVVSAFVAKRPYDRLGIVCFGRSPYLVSPLTMDHAWALDSLKETDFTTGTAIGEALAASQQFLEHNSHRSKVIILVTDGQNMLGRPPVEAAPLLQRAHIRLYSILIGPEIVTSSLAANHELNKTSRLTGGQFFQARDTTALKRVCELIDQLEKKALLQKRFVVWNELFPWFIAPALGVLLLELIWRNLLTRRTP
jgi:Ca-activated chloride channel family protein